MNLIDWNKKGIYLGVLFLSSCMSHIASVSKVSDPDWWTAAKWVGT